MPKPVIHSQSNLQVLTPESSLQKNLTMTYVWRHTMTLQQLKYIVMVAECKNITDAAESFYLTAKPHSGDSERGEGNGNNRIYKNE